MVKVAPSILSADFSNLGRAVKDIELWEADYIHIDIMDGTFTPSFTFGPQMVKALRRHSDKTFDVHLMQLNPMRWIDAFADAGADILTVHVEAEPHLNRAIQLIKQRGMKAGVVLNPATPLVSLEYVLEEVDMVLLMGVNPGAGGQKFIPSVLKKIAQLRKRIDTLGLNVELEVDGGINLDTAKSCVEAGATVLVAGSAIFGSKDPAEMVTLLRCMGE